MWRSVHTAGIYKQAASLVQLVRGVDSATEITRRTVRKWTSAPLATICHALRTFTSAYQVISAYRRGGKFDKQTRQVEFIIFYSGFFATCSKKTPNIRFRECRRSTPNWNFFLNSVLYYCNHLIMLSPHHFMHHIINSFLMFSAAHFSFSVFGNFSNRHPHILIRFFLIFQMTSVSDNEPRVVNSCQFLISIRFSLSTFINASNIITDIEGRSGKCVRYCSVSTSN
jgi:hypothetical protein